jgi:hypothetical protein
VNDVNRINSSPRLAAIKRQLGVSQFHEFANYTETGGIYGMFEITRLVVPRKTAVIVKRFADVSAEDLDRNHLLFLGKPDADPSISALLSRGEFGYGPNRIVVLHPRPGEPADYVDQHDLEAPNHWAQKHALISMLPGAAPGMRTLALTGAGSDQLRALAEYVTSPSHVEELVRHLRHADGSFPPYYQVVIKAQF